MIEDKKVIFSGIKPSGNLTLGNYIGALKNWTILQHEYNCLFCVVDMHAITVRQDPAELRKKSKELLKLYIACGLDPEKNIMYIQSQVPAHAELGWILNCYTYVGEMGRMTQYKEKKAKQNENTTVGLFDYPVLMAADILLYQTDLVPVGDDQKQHVEITRDIAMRFNNLYSETFKIPEVYIPPVGARIMGLQNPTAKMSKSDDDENDCILLLDPIDAIARKIKRAVTDTEKEIRYTKEKPGIKNLLDIYMSCTNMNVKDAEARFTNCGYGEFKQEVADAVVSTIRPIQEKYKEIDADKEYLDKILKQNAERASSIANRTLGKVKKKIGFVV
ncbi:MAG TPA: tryptophan--tRNA ligase [Clostridiales bacterium]|nr:MAG: tryptophan--tRNA ligase [Clostridiales bacterium GWD2_32_59]HAN09808.1 tryptophan--tRNA ligase [Clostridiales bacterium]